MKGLSVRNAIIMATTLIVISTLMGYWVGLATAPKPTTDIELGTSKAFDNYVVIKLKRAGETEWKTIAIVKNTVTDIGLEQIMHELAFSNSTALESNPTKYISLSADEASELSSSITKLPGEITTNNLSRAAGTVSVVNSSAYQVVYTFTASGTTTVNCSGLHWDGTSDSDGNLFAYNTFTTTTLYDDDQLQITWTIDIS